MFKEGQQHTIKSEILLKGVGLHTGLFANLKLIPASANHGIVFCRLDLENQPTVLAHVNNVVNTQRCTTIGSETIEVKTVEHLLAAFAALGVDNARVELDNIEVPILDGSSAPFIAAIKKVGLEEQTELRKFFEITEPIVFKDEENEVELIALPHDGFELTCLIDFNSPALSSQFAEMKSFEEFEEKIATARTFCFLHELEYLASQDLIKGGDVENALVLVDRPIARDRLASLANLLEKPVLEIEEDGYLKSSKPRFVNEPARHKLLDVVGDLALLGLKIKGRIIAKRPGHKSNVAFVKIINSAYKKHLRDKEIPVYDPSSPPIGDIQSILELLPHRFPFLLVDKVIELSDQHVVAVKNVTFNEAYFQGHFPNHPIMPGVLIIEAMAQAGGVLLLNTVENPKEFVTYFLRMEKVKFRKPVGPGDTLIFKLELLSPIRRGICEMKAMAYVNNKLTTEAVLTAQLVKK